MGVCLCFLFYLERYINPDLSDRHPPTGIAHFGYFDARFDEAVFGNTNLKRDAQVNIKL